MKHTQSTTSPTEVNFKYLLHLSHLLPGPGHLPDANSHALTSSVLVFYRYLFVDVKLSFLKRDA